MSCRGCMKFILAVINLLTMIAGLALVVAGILAITKSREFFPQLGNYNENLRIMSIVIVVLGVILLFIGTFGCFGAVTGNKCLLNFYFVLILVVLLAELAVLIYGIVKRVEIEEQVLDAVKEIFEKTNNSTATEMELGAVSTIQISFRCCGFDRGPQYWTRWNTNNKVPASCCGARADPNSAAYYCDRYDPKIQTRGCQRVLQRYWNRYIAWGILATLGMAVLVNIFCLYGALRLKRRSYDDYNYAGYSEHTNADTTAKSSGFNTTWL